MKQPKPEPVTVTIICSLCDQRWDDHGDNPTPLDCIRLLKDALARRPPATWLMNGMSNTASGSITMLHPRQDPPDAKVG